MKGGHLTVLVVDDDPGLRTLCRINLELEGYRVLEAGSERAAEEALARNRINVVLLDVRLGADDGRRVLETLRRTRPEVAVAMLTGSEDPSALGADAVIPKPFELAAFSATVRELADRGERVG